ncbi:MAG: cytochrome P450 [Kibdelosporangium sp.]
MDDFSRLFDNDQAFIRDPYPAYARMRATAPVWFESSAGVYVVSRYQEQREILGDPATFSSRYMSGPRVPTQLAELSQQLDAVHLDLLSSVNTMDGQRHARLRRLAAKAFSPAAVRGLEPFITTRCTELADRIQADQPVDFVGVFAAPLAFEIIAEALGVQGSDYGFFRWCTRSVIEVTSGREVSPDLFNEYVTGIADFSVFFRRKFDELRAEPDSSALAQLVAACDDGQSLSDEELLALCLSIVVAGTESTTNLLASVVLRLAVDPDLLAVCRMCPATVGVAIEELIRLETPFQGFFRTALVDTEVGGVAVPAGSHLFLLFGSGNRDESVFGEPDTLRLRRLPERQHLGFGHGVHFCLGAMLARTGVRIAVETIIQRFGRVELARPAAEVKYRNHLISRGPAELTVRFGAGSGSAN